PGRLSRVDRHVRRHPRPRNMGRTRTDQPRHTRQRQIDQQQGTHSGQSPLHSTIKKTRPTNSTTSHRASTIRPLLTASLTLWVPNSSSTAVISSIVRRWMSGMIVDRGGATAVFELPAAGGAWLGL